MTDERLVPRRSAEEGVAKPAPSAVPSLATYVDRFAASAEQVVSASRITMEPIFSHKRYDALVQETVNMIAKLSALKGSEYAGDEDRLANFRRNAKNLGVNMETVWAVYAAKHWDAVMQFINDLNASKARERMEPLSGRLDDIIVYCILFKAMLEEREAK